MNLKFNKGDTNGECSLLWETSFIWLIGNFSSARSGSAVQPGLINTQSFKERKTIGKVQKAGMAKVQKNCPVGATIPSHLD